ncbi:unnamed protein product [Parnassius apollo]|uniref:(apollo) hypothetical protein n=1 Tax=Parnassius apollo TaxID=110799 RepID=A0A8S3XJ26_PARAO|nr:unnamed protein product [Parnassius apollo]
MDKLFSIAFVILQCSICLAKISPDYIKPCVGLKSDCLKKNIQDTIPLYVPGIPSIGVNSTDPLKYDLIEMELPGGLTIQFTDGVMTGLKKCIVDDVKFENNEADITLHCDIVIKGKYKAKGQILIVSLNGDGDAKLKITDILLKAKLKFADKVRNGVTHYEVKNYKVSYTIRDKVHFDLTNLFKGSPEISQTVLTFLNENWKEVVNEFGGPIIDFIVNVAFKNVQVFFREIPKDELIVL